MDLLTSFSNKEKMNKLKINTFLRATRKTDVLQQTANSKFAHRGTSRETQLHAWTEASGVLVTLRTCQRLKWPSLKARYS